MPRNQFNWGGMDGWYAGQTAGRRGNCRAVASVIKTHPSVAAVPRNFQVVLASLNEHFSTIKTS